jgi:hypothetical protein
MLENTDLGSQPQRFLAWLTFNAAWLSGLLKASQLTEPCLSTTALADRLYLWFC